VSDVQQPQQPPRLPGAWTLTRDILSFLGGWALIFMEVTRPEVREAVLLLGGSLVGVPGLAVGAASVAGALTQRRNGTPGSSQQPAEVPSSPSF